MKTTFSATRITRLRRTGMFCGAGAAGIAVVSSIWYGQLDLPSLIGWTIGTVVCGLFVPNHRSDIVVGDGVVEGLVRTRPFVVRRSVVPLSAIDLGRSRDRSFWKCAYLMTAEGKRIVLNYWHLTSDQTRQIFALIREQQDQLRQAG